MENEQCMCYITYAVPASMMPKLMIPGVDARPSAPPTLYPPDFVPGWYMNGCFPEDDFED